jgi:D-sedoheptulose 7-phosphate isomerase
MDDSIQEFLDNHQKSITEISSNNDQLKKSIEKLLAARDNSRTIFTIGNGGSASTASHFTSDLLKTAITKNKKRFKSISLTDNMSVISAWSNDVSYDDIFLEQLKNFASKNDILIAFSGSGRSKNIIKCLNYAKKEGMFLIGFTGKSGGDFPELCDISYNVPNDDMLNIESLHIVICHCIISVIRSMDVPMFEYD